MPNYFLDVDAWTGTAVERLRLATRTAATLPGDVPANTIYDGRILDVGSSQRALTQNGGAFTRATVSETLCDLANADRGLDAWLSYGFSGRCYTLMWQDGVTAVVSRGVVQCLESSDASKTLRLRARDRLGELSKPLLTARYAGTTTTAGPTAEGGPSLAGTIKPYYFGAPAVMPGQIGTYLNSSVPGILVNPYNNLYQFCANAVSQIVVFDGGVPLTPTGDYASLAALIDAPLLASEYATCLALCIVRLGALPQKDVMADITEGATAALRTAAQVAQRMLALVPSIASADIDTVRFDALDDFNAAEIGIYIDGELGAGDALTQVLESVGAVLCPTDLGVLQAVWIDDPEDGTSVQTFTERDCLNSGATFQIFAGPSAEGDGIPASSVALTWGRVWRPMGPGELLGDPTIADDPVGGTARRDFLKREVRTATAEDATVQVAHLLASQLTGTTLLTTKAATDAEALRRLNLNKVRRDRLVWPVPLKDAEQIAIGNVVTIDIPMFGYDGGKKMRVTGRNPDFTRRVMNLDLWG